MKILLSFYFFHNNLHSFYCGSKEHVLCSLIDREFPILEKKDEKEIFNDFNFFISNKNNESDDDRSSVTPKNEEEIKTENMEIEQNEEEEEIKDNNDKTKKKKKKKIKNIFDDLKNEEIKDTIFCGLWKYLKVEEKLKK